MERLLDKPSKNRDFGLEVYTHLLCAIIRGLFIDTYSELFHRNVFTDIHSWASSKANPVIPKPPIPSQMELAIWKGVVHFSFKKYQICCR